MHGVVLVPNKRRDILWLNSAFGMRYTNWNSVVGHWQNPPITSGSDVPVAGAYTELGGVFASPPVAVETDGNHLHVFGLGTDYAVYYKMFTATNPVPTQWTADWERLGGDFMSTPVVVSTGASRIDLFGLGADQGMVHSTWSGTSWSAFDELGGCFSGTPVVLPTADGKFDIFARAVDYKLYHLLYDPAVQSDWSILGGGLLGEPVAASAPAAIRVQQRIFVFAVGDDGAMWTTFFDGKLWKPCTSLGILAQGSANGNVPATTFFSEPVAIWSNPAPSVVIVNHEAVPAATAGPATGPFFGRIDLFCVDNGTAALWHTWLDTTGWKAWENLGGNFVCAPSVMGAPPPSIIVQGPQTLQFSVIEPGPDSVMKLRSFDGRTWSYAWTAGPIFGLPNAFSVAVTEVDIAAIRSLRTDTNKGTANLTIGRWPMLTAYMYMGDVGPGTYGQDFAMSLNRVSVELAEPFAYFYVIMNQALGHDDVNQAVDQAIAKVATDFLTDFAKKAIFPDAQVTIGSLLGLSSGVAAGAAGPFVLEAAIAAAAALGIQVALSAILADCDGIVASGSVTFKNGRLLQQMVRNATAHQVLGSIHSLGTDSPSGCGGNSDYTVKYLVTWLGR